MKTGGDHSMRCFTALAAVLLGTSACERTTRPVADYVDPFIGTGAHGHVYPGATVPFGMVQLSPDNGRNGWDWVSGYHYSDSIIVGFSHTHLSGTGIGDLADILVMPVAVEPNLTRHYESRDDRDYKSRISHSDESADPGYYRVRLLDPSIEAELTATDHVGLHRYTYPASTEAGVVLDLGYAINWDRPTDTYVRVESDTLVVGYRLSTGWAHDERVYFAMAFSKPFTTVALTNGEVAAESRQELGGGSVRAYFGFATEANESVELKLGLSYVDIDGALRNLSSEAPDWDFDGTRAAARAAWERELSRVRVEGGTDSAKTVFYTALYHTKLAPVLFEDVDGRYRGADGEMHTAEGFTNYSIYSLWDTFRGEHPLFTIVSPERVNDLVNSMLAFEQESGYLPVWSLVGNETNTMTGHHAVPVIADAFLKGFRGFDTVAAFAAVEKSAMADHRGLRFYKRYGYIPSELEVESVTKTLEYAYDDWATAQLALGAGDAEAYRRFRQRASAYRLVFDSTTGFMRGRHADGSWVTPFDPIQSQGEHRDYTEGNAWQHSWFVPQDVRGLIELMGGDAAFIAKLDSLFTIDTVLTGENVAPDISGMIGQYAHGNEPSHHIAYLYSYAGAPWKTQERVRTILETLYDATPEGLAGNEDCGQMSAWYVLSALGFYPVNPADGVYVIGSPVFPEATIELAGGGQFTVRAKGASLENRYIQSATLDGRPFARSFIRHSDIVRGGTLELVMGPEPNNQWATGEGARPPSMSDPVDRSQMAERVKADFRHAWDGYVRYAWGHDQLRPLSHGYRDWYDSTSVFMTPVDAFDTALLMGLNDEAQAAKRIVLDSLSFDHDITVQVFEVTIRLLGGLLSAYQLDGDPGFLALAKDLGERMLPAFESATGMPYVRVNLKTGVRSEPVNNPAEIGTLMLEFGTLSKLTGDTRFYDAAKRGVQAVFARRSSIGLVGTRIDVETGEWRDTDSHVGARIDSYYEYLLKAALLFDDEDFRAMYETSISAVNRYVADERNNGLWYGQVDMNTGERTGTRFGALEAFLPAVLALGGDLDRAERLMESVYLMWTTWDIEPEVMDYATMEIRYPSYVLRPEALESAFYLYRLTGEARYLEMGQTMFQSIERWSRTPDAFAALRSVVTKEQADDLESFFFAETLKYAYLLFAPPETLDLHSVVFNTEAHPLRRVGEGG